MYVGYKVNWKKVSVSDSYNCQSVKPYITEVGRTSICRSDEQPSRSDAQHYSVGYKTFVGRMNNFCMSDAQLL